MDVACEDVHCCEMQPTNALGSLARVRVCEL
jgi:hypothetical protein